MNKHTPGPWRWEFNAENKTVHLAGGRPMFDLTVMDFSRWGMNRATPRFRDTSEDGFNLMDRLCDKPEWIIPEVGREHHKKWHQLVSHPDAQLIAAAPDLLEALKAMVRANDGVAVMPTLESKAQNLAIAAARAAIEKATS